MSIISSHVLLNLLVSVHVDLYLEVVQDQSIAFRGWFSHIYLIAWIAKSSATPDEERPQRESSIPGTYEGKCLASVSIPPAAVEKREPYKCA